MSENQRPVRVRFAPSPTGYLHVGGARTAIYNYFYAKAMGGTFYLRIEDTDRKRYNEAALHDLLRDLKWLGLQWDEGPEVGGPYGPYFQSERLDIYARAVESLLEKGLAYYCFCTEERLEEVRKAQEASGQAVSGYDRKCRDLPLAEARARLAAGEKAVVRFKIPLDGVTGFVDQIRGSIETRNALLDDLVILKRDKYPTYHLASVVDDHAMGTTHVLRGDEWISSTPKHVLLYQALGWEPPVFCHLPVILAAGGGKLSKRKGAASVGDFRDQGYLPETLVNFLALLGWNPGDDREVMSLDEMIAKFTLDRINPKAAAFDEKKLEWMNGQHIHRKDTAWLAQYLRENLEAQGVDTASVSQEKMIGIADLLKTRVHFLKDLPGMSRYFFIAPETYDEKARTKAWGPGSRQTTTAVREQLAQLSSFDAPSIEQAFMSVCTRLDAKLGVLVHPVRLAVSGVAAGPGLFELLEVIGQAEVLRRLEIAEPLMG
ncbi:MAG TPA: glutamate--tRNA ligase [Fibrobacteraceae bacterium]|nr:glutamate--tRNA ligase [Fibrobacteraceae bacterium]